jgi:hypothetical protein
MRYFEFVGHLPLFFFGMELQWIDATVLVQCVCKEPLFFLFGSVTQNIQPCGVYLVPAPFFLIILLLLFWAQ